MTGARVGSILLVAVWQLAGPEASATGIASGIRSEADYRLAFDRETEGRFSTLLAAGDADLSLRDYALLVASFAAIEDALYDAYSAHANTLPRWYASRLADLGLDSVASEFVREELSSGDFDRVVHAYYLASLSQLHLVNGDIPTPLWSAMRSVARSDPENRYWISLALAEAKLLPFHAYDRLHTKMATGIESVSERIGKNADWIGPRIPRLLGIDEADEKVSHLRIRYAQGAARQRVRNHQLASMGGPAAYRAIHEELSEMETGTFESRRFLALMRNDLPLLLERFGLPEDPEALVETLRFLCRGRGANRMILWDAADDVTREIEKRLAAVPSTPPPPPPPGAPEILAMGREAHAYLESSLRDASKPEDARRLFEEDVIPAVIAKKPPEDPKPLRRAIRDAYYTLGYPNDLRTAYQRALDALGPEESPHAAAAREKLSVLQHEFERVRSNDEFDRAFAAYRQASSEGRIPRHDVEPAFTRAFAASALRVLEVAASKSATAKRNSEDARRARTESGLEIESAEAAIVDANRQIRQANKAIATFEERQQNAVTARNEAVGLLNEAVEQVEAAHRSGADFEQARDRARKLEAELNALITTKEAEANEAASDAAGAEQLAVDQLNRARREGSRAKSEARRENEASEATRKADTAYRRSQEQFAEVLGRLIAGLDFVGIQGEPAWVGDPSRDEPTRLAGVALLLEGSGPLDSSAAQALGRERDTSPPPLGSLAALTLARRSTP